MDLVGRLLPALAPDRGEEECPGVAVAGVAVRAQADAQPLLLQFPLLSPSLLLFTLPASLVPGRAKDFLRYCQLDVRSKGIVSKRRSFFEF